jgi:hypothetical protein
MSFVCSILLFAHLFFCLLIYSFLRARTSRMRLRSRRSSSPTRARSCATRARPSS